VKFDNKQTKQKPKPKAEVSVDSRIKQITTNDTMSKDSVKTSLVSQSGTNTSVANSYINRVTSVINGEEIVLSSVHFRFDQYKLADKMITISNENANKINTVVSKNSNIKIKLEGNCDERGTDEYNYALGLKRTKSAKNALVKNGISSDSIVVVSYGESNPICSKQTSKCWKQNRRVDYNLLP
jgi:peptidoglycan-associated lipoprotein